MDGKAPVSLGAAVNVLLGYDCNWDPADLNDSPFFDVPSPGIAQTPTEPTYEAVKQWGYPLIPLHDTAEGVLSRVLDINVKSETDDTAGSRWGSGALLIRNADRKAALEALHAQLGIDFGVANRGYALLEVRREVATSTHETFSHGIFVGAWTDKGGPKGSLRHALHHLPRALASGNAPQGLRTADDASQYLNLFAQSGTHFVSAIQSGDRILQVLAYDAAQWKQVAADFERFSTLLEGPNAYQSFLYYTRPLNQAGYGLVAQRGLITATSRDAALLESVADGEWVENA
jgi:hypothetical protein